MVNELENKKKQQNKKKKKIKNSCNLSKMATA